MATVETRQAAEACVFGGGVVGMGRYENQYGKTVYKVCSSHVDLLELEQSPVKFYLLTQGTTKSNP